MSITLHNADCFDIFPTIASGSVDMVCGYSLRYHAVLLGFGA